MTQYNIPRNQIFNSRNLEFKRQLLEETNGKGVDIVLNSLSGEGLHASWECVAEFGKMIELGKRDIMGNAKLDMSLFAGNRMFFGVDLLQYARQRPGELQR